MIPQTPLLPSDTPYTILDYGVTVLVLIVLGIVLWFVFRTMRTILADHAAATKELAENLQVLRDAELTLISELRHEQDDSRREHEARRREHRALSAQMERHVDAESAKRHAAEQAERDDQQEYRRDQE